ncbi:hypothetical protein ACGFS9_18140 [Streptomyces sp. NPDC048566]|uniref:hypothetical protein n=1 Tax=Streptomyces sp. NPDC048566 TaxID=3365569 RepID=UPI003717FEA7
MTADTSSRTIIRTETEWAEARRRGSGPRTCVPATIDRTARPDRPVPEGNIVRGED